MKKDEKKFAPSVNTPGIVDDDAPPYVIRLYQRNKNGWKIVGYKCPHCFVQYKTLRKEFFTHMDRCTGPKHKKNLED